MFKPTNITRRAIIGLISTLPVLLTGLAPAGAGEKQPVVVELFTSQGCSSCPPADKILGELSKRKDVIALTLNVDYWDYLGWRDTLGSSEHTKRQRVYAANRGTRQIYTPQMVVNGHIDVVGSRRAQVMNTLKREAATTTRVPMKILENKDEIVIEVGKSPSPELAKKSTIWVMVTSPRVSVPIARGENSGRKITYHNVVRQMVPAGMWTGKAKRITLPKAGLEMTADRGCVVLLQQGNIGKIIGAATNKNFSL